MSVPQGPQSPRGNGGNPFSPRGNGNNPDQSNRRNQNAGPGGPKGVMRSPWLWGIIIVLMVVLLFQMLSGRGPQTIDTKDGMDILTSQASDVKFANIVDNTRQVQLELNSDYKKTDPETGKERNYGKDVQFYYTYAQSAQVVKAVEKANPKNGWTASMKETSMWTYMLTSILPFIIILALFWFLMSRMGSGSGMLGMGGKKNAGKLSDGQIPKTKFSDVAGEEAAVQEVEEIKDFLQDPSKYKALGARIPRGVLLYGPPAPARRCLRAPSPARRACRSTRWPAPTSSRCSLASAPRVCVTCSTRRRRTRRRLSSSTRSTPWAASAAPAWAAAMTSASRRSTSCSWRWTASTTTRT